MNLQELRDYVRTQLDVDEEELPNPLLDAYFSEGFERTIALEVRWPFYETRWDVAYLPEVPDRYHSRPGPVLTCILDPFHRPLGLLLRGDVAPVVALNLR